MIAFAETLFRLDREHIHMVMPKCKCTVLICRQYARNIFWDIRRIIGQEKELQALSAGKGDERLKCRCVKYFCRFIIFALPLRIMKRRGSPQRKKCKHSHHDTVSLSQFSLVAFFVVLQKSSGLCIFFAILFWGCRSMTTCMHFAVSQTF